MFILGVLLKKHCMLVESRVGIWCAVRLSTHYTNIWLDYTQDTTYATATNSLSHMTASLPPAYRDCHEKVIIRMNFLLFLKHSKKVACFEFLNDTFTILSSKNVYYACTSML